MLIINKASDSDDEASWNDPTHLIDMACARVQMLISTVHMTEHNYVALQVFTINTYITINNYIATNKSSQLLLLVIFLMRCSADSSARLSTRTRTTGARRARARARARRARATRTTRSATTSRYHY